MKLYFSPGACSLSPRIALHEAGLAAQYVKVDLAAKRLEDGSDFRGINPKGYVPTLELDDGQVLTEGPAIVQYIADLVPERGLAPPAGSMERYRLMEWLNFISTELHKGFGQLFHPSGPDDKQSAIRDRLASRIEVVNTQLGDGEYAMGASFTVADAYLFTVLRWAPLVKFDLSTWPKLLAYVDRVRARPAVREALIEEGLLKIPAAQAQ